MSRRLNILYFFKNNNITGVAMPAPATLSVATKWWHNLKPLLLEWMMAACGYPGSARQTAGCTPAPFSHVPMIMCYIYVQTRNPKSIASVG